MKRLKRHQIIALFLAIAMLFVGPAVLADKGLFATEEPSVAIQNDFAQEGVPLTAEATGFSAQPTLTWKVDGTEVAVGDSYTPIAGDLEKTISVTASFGDETSEASMYFSKLPVVYIDTENGAPIVSKEDYINANMKIQGSADHPTGLYDGLIEIRGRGNSTWRDSPKKPYKIKLDKKTSLFDMGKNKHWNLLANALDRSLMRNTIATDLAKSMEMDAMDTVFVDVILNGEYVGNYQLCEQVRVDETRVDIADWEGEAEDETDLSGITKANGYDTTGGYLMEINFQYDEISKFTTSDGVKITFKNPEYANTNSEMMNYVQGYLEDYSDAVSSPDFYNSKGQHYSDLFDFDDLVDYWLVCEYMNTVDAGRYSSTYFYKDTGGDLFHMGPIWDFDYSSGNYLHTEFNGYSCPPDHWQYGKMGTWYSKLVGDPYFVSQLQERYWKMHEAFERLPSQLDGYRALIEESAVKDKIVWEMPTTFDYEADLLRKWLVDRTNWIDEQFVDLETALASLEIYDSGEPIELTVQTAQGEKLAEDTILSAGVAADAMIQWNDDLKVTAKIGGQATKVAFYLNGKRLDTVTANNGEATLIIASEDLVERGSRNVIQVRSQNALGDFLGSQYTTVVKEQYAPSADFAWPTVKAEGYNSGICLKDIAWEQEGKAVYDVEGQKVEVPGTFSWEDESIVPTLGTGVYNVVFTPSVEYQKDYATVVGALTVAINGSVRPLLQELYSQNQQKEEGRYTAQSFEIFKKAMQNAKTVLETETADETTIQEAYDALKTAIDGLIERAKDDKIEELVAICKRAKEASFTEESFKNLQSAVSTAEEFVKQGGTAKEVDAAYKELQRAFNQLERKR